jgi:predicted pyridoxine 5'-phosphate oxidase superfamily flavin-nucleotide-binding protein
MAEFYSESHRKMQDAFDTRRLADVVHDKIMRAALAPMDSRFIEASDFFFLSTLDHNGYPTVSYKGGAPGFVKILDDRTLAFPAYDGNGMFYSMGNIAEGSIAGPAKIGMLFIDFEQPRRLRLHGMAQVSTDDPLRDSYPEALMVVRVVLDNIFTNCPRYIHKHQRTENSRFVPTAGVETPMPEWKRVDYLQEKLPAKDRERAKSSGETITEAEYRANFWSGLD